MLSKRQFASAVGSSQKWVDNASRALGRRFDRSNSDARWLGLVHALTQAFDMSLARAADVANAALQHNPNVPIASIAAPGDDALRVVVDLERYHTRFSIALAAALLDAPYHRGRPQRQFRHAQTRPSIFVAASRLGVKTNLVRALAHVTPACRFAVLGDDIRTVLADLSRAHIQFVLMGDVAAIARGAPAARPRLEICYAAHAGVETRLAELLVHWRARPLDVAPCEYPFAPDERSVRDAPILALATRLGPVILRRVADGEFAALADASDLLDLGGVEALVPRVPTLVSALRATRQPIPATAIPELEVAAVAVKRIN